MLGNGSFKVNDGGPLDATKACARVDEIRNAATYLEVRSHAEPGVITQEQFAFGRG